MVYFCKLEPDEKDGGFSVSFPDVQGVHTEGDTLDEALFNAWEALNGSLEAGISHGFPLPEATSTGQDLYPIEVEPHILIAWELRSLRGDLPQSEIARRLGLSYQSYQRLENPTKGNPTVRTLEKVAKAFGKRLQVSLV